jgi:dihydroorotase
MSESLTIRRPDDWHVHLRDGDMLEAVVPYTARQFARAIVMPNLSPPITGIDQAIAYRRRIKEAAAAGGFPGFEPLMTAYLTDESDGAVLVEGHRRGVFTAAKLYPAHATTGSAHGVTDVANIRPALAAMEQAGMPLLIHGEVTDPAVDVFDREAAFIDRVLSGLVRDFPALKIVFEHITTLDAVDFVRDSGPQVAATVTPQHLHLNRNAILVGGIRPHAYCLPILKREQHRLALRKAATSGSAKFFLGTDTAPHARHTKEAACGCAGIFNAPYALESYAAVFEEEGALDKFEGFASVHGPEFYGLALNQGTVTLERAECRVPERLDHGESGLVPFHAGETLGWRLA